jgi:DNA polymerase III sliding clamp (beta) subunit (PCNA family)
MEFKIEKAALLSGLYLAQGISDRKSTMPILANVLLRTDGKDKLLVAATDLNVTVTAELPCRSRGKARLSPSVPSICTDIVKSLPGGSRSDRTEESVRGDSRRQGRLQGRRHGRSRFQKLNRIIAK